MDKKQPSILKQKVRVPLQEVMLPDFPDDETVTTTVTRSRRVSFGTNFVKEFIVGSAVSTQFVSEYEHALSSSDSSRSVTQSHFLEQSTFSAQENIRLSTEGGALNLSMNKAHSENVSVSSKGNSDNRYDFEVDKKQLNVMKQSKNLTDLHLGPEKVKHDELNRCEKKTKCGKFSSTICFSADSPTADMEFTEGCINLAKSILDKKKKAITVFIQAKPKETKPEGNETFVFETSDAEMSITKCVEPDEKINKSVMDVDEFTDSDMDDSDVGNPFLPGRDNLDDLEESNGGILKAAFEIDPDTEKSLFSPKKKLNDIFNFSADESMVENMSLDDSQIAQHVESTFCPQSEGMELTKCVKLIPEPEKIPETLQTSAMDFTKCVRTNQDSPLGRDNQDSPLGSDMMEETPCKKFPLNRSHVSFGNDVSSSDDSMDVTGCLNVPSNPDVNKLFSLPPENEAKIDSLDDLTNNSGKADSVERFVGACFTGDNNNKNESFNDLDLDSSLSEKEDPLATPLEGSLDKNGLDDSGMDLTEAVTNEIVQKIVSSPEKFSQGSGEDLEEITTPEKSPPSPEKILLPERTIDQIQLSQINDPLLLDLIEKPEDLKISTPEKTIPIEKPEEEEGCGSDEFETSDANKENQDPILKLTIDSPEQTFMNTVPDIAPPEISEEEIQNEGNVSGVENLESPEKGLDLKSTPEKADLSGKMSPEKEILSIGDKNEEAVSENDVSGMEMTPMKSVTDEKILDEEKMEEDLNLIKEKILDEEKNEEIVEKMEEELNFTKEKVLDGLNISKQKSPVRLEDCLNLSRKIPDTNREDMNKTPEISQLEKIEKVEKLNGSKITADKSINMNLDVAETAKNLHISSEKPRVSFTELQKSFDKNPASPEKPRVSITELQRSFSKLPASPEKPTEFPAPAEKERISFTELHKSFDKNLASPEKPNEFPSPAEKPRVSFAELRKSFNKVTASPEKCEAEIITPEEQKSETELSPAKKSNDFNVTYNKSVTETRKSPEKLFPTPEKLKIAFEAEMDLDASINADKSPETDPKDMSKSIININSNTIILHSETPHNDRSAATFTVTPKDMTYVVPNSTYVLEEEQPPADSPVKVEIPKDEQVAKKPEIEKSPRRPEIQESPKTPEVQKAPKTPVVQKAPKTPEIEKPPKTPEIEKPKAPEIEKSPKTPVLQNSPKKPEMTEKVHTPEKPELSVKPAVKRASVELSPLPESQHKKHRLSLEFAETGIRLVTDISFNEMDDVTLGEVDECKEMTNTGNIFATGNGNETENGSETGNGNGNISGNENDVGIGNEAENGNETYARNGYEKMETTTENQSESNDVDMEIDSNSKSFAVDSTVTIGDGKIISLLTEQAKETNCLWKMKELKNTKTDDDSWSFSFPILSSVAVVDFKLKSSDDTDSYSVVTGKEISLTYENKYLTSKPLSVIEFGFIRMKKFFEDEKKIENVRHIPYFLDLINSFSRKLNNYLNQILSVLEQYPGSDLKNDALSFRLFSFPILFSSNVVVDLKNLFRLSRDCLSFEVHFGDLNQNKIKDVFEECLKCENSLVEFIISSTKYIIRLELEHGRLSKRDHIQLLPDYLKNL